MERSCHVKIDLNSVAAKKLDSLCVSRQAHRLCHSSRSGHGTESLIGGFKHALKDFGADYGIVRPAEGN